MSEEKTSYDPMVSGLNQDLVQFSMLAEFLAIDVKYPGNAPVFYEKLAEYLADPSDPTGLKVDNLCLMANNLKMQFTRISDMLEILNKKLV